MKPPGLFRGDAETPRSAPTARTAPLPGTAVGEEKPAPESVAWFPWPDESVQEPEVWLRLLLAGSPSSNRRRVGSVQSPSRYQPDSEPRGANGEGGGGGVEGGEGGGRLHVRGPPANWHSPPAMEWQQLKSCVPVGGHPMPGA